MQGGYTVFPDIDPIDWEAQDRRRFEYLTTGLQDYSAATLQKIIDAKAGRRYYWHCSIIDMVSRDEIQRDESFVNDYLHLSHCFTTAPIFELTAEVILALESLHHYEGLEPQHVGSEYSARRAEQCTAIITVANHLRRGILTGHASEDSLRDEPFVSDHEMTTAYVNRVGEGCVRVISDERLRRLITSCDQPSEITNVVSERGLTTYDDITAILIPEINHSAVLKHGIL